MKLKFKWFPLGLLLVYHKYNFDLSIPLQNPRPACNDGTSRAEFDQPSVSVFEFLFPSHTSLNITEPNQCYLKNIFIDKMII